MVKTHTKNKLLLSIGFTLIELLVVLAIVSLLLTLVAPRYFRSMDAAKEAVLMETLHRTRETLDKFYGDQGRYPNSLEELVERHYLRSLPFDPITESTTSWLLVPSSSQARGQVFDLHSGAMGQTLEGRPFQEL